jgi:hypothetical protein
MKSAGAVDLLLMTRRGFKIDCAAALTTAQKSARPLLMTRRGLKIDCFTAQKNTGPFAMTEVSFHNEVRAALWRYS